MNPRLTTTEPTEADIQHAAYYLWQEQGRPSGRDLDIWLSAREQLKHRLPVQVTGATAQRAGLDHRRHRQTATRQG